MFRINIFSLVALMALIAFTGCSKDKKANQEKAETVVADYFLAVGIFDQAYDNLDKSAQQESGLNGFTNPEEQAANRNCGEVAFTADENTFFPAILSINYGAGCDYEDHRISGRLTATFNGFLFELDKSIHIGFDVFSIDEYAVNGSYELFNRGSNTLGQQVWEHVIQDGKLSGPQGYQVGYGANATTTQIAGQDTHWWNAGNDGLTDDVWEQEHTATYVDPFGAIFNVFYCHPINQERCLSLAIIRSSCYQR